MMPSVQEKEVALDLVQELFDNDFWYAISYHEKNRGMGSWTWFDEGLYEWKHQHDMFLAMFPGMIYSGATKACIVPTIKELYEKWVIKISFVRDTNPDYVRRGEVDDYCEREARYYQEACVDHLEQYFAATYDIGQVNGVNIFLQEYARPDEDSLDETLCSYIDSHSERYGVSRNDYDDDDAYHDTLYGEITEMDIEDKVEAIFGEELDDLVAFIDSHSINDLHTANWGTTMDGRIVIFDFSGFEG